MNISQKVADYVKSTNLKAQAYYTEHKDITKFVTPAVTSSRVVERIMRLGVEERILGPMTDDELYVIATATLHEDYINYNSNNQLVPIRCIWDIKSIFAEQIKHTCNKLYYMTYVNDTKRTKTVVSLNSDDYDFILTHYKYAELSQSGVIPTLY